MKDVFYFGSPLAKYSLNAETIISVNEIAEQVLQKTPQSALLDQSKKLFSAVNSEVKFPFYILKSFSKEIVNLAQKYHQNFKTAPDDGELEFIISHMWIVSQRETEWGYLHSHTGSISGILYLKIPKDLGEGLNPEDKRRSSAGCISFAEGTPGLYRNSIKHITPVEGDLYLFPADLMHTIYPFFGDKERRSLSFNIQINKMAKKS